MMESINTSQSVLAEILEQVPRAIRERTLGPATGDEFLSAEELARKVHSRILERDDAIRANQTDIALALFLAQETGLYKELGYRSWREYVTSFDGIDPRFPSIRQTARYLAAVRRWIIEIGMDIDVLDVCGPSILGEIAEAGAVRNRTEAKAWTQMIQYGGVATARSELKRYRGLITGTDATGATKMTRSADRPQQVRAQAGQAIADEGPAEKTIQGQSGVSASILPSPQAIDRPVEEAEDPITDEQIRKLGERVNHIYLEVVEDEDEDGQLFIVRLFHGGPNTRPALELYCRRFDFRQMTKKEASLLHQELQRQENLQEIDRIMREP